MPSCLVAGRRLLDKKEITPENAVSDKLMLSKRVRYLETLLAKFFNQWKKEYVTPFCE